MRRWMGLLLTGLLTAGCASSANVAAERETLMRLDREWSASAKSVDKFVSYYASDATVYPPGMPLTTGAGPIKKIFSEMMSAPGFALEFAPTKAEVSASGDVGYTAGAYSVSMGGPKEKGKYIAIWRKQSDGQWKVTEDIFNADAPVEAPVAHVLVAPASLKWGDAPPNLPAGAKLAVVAGDPSKPEPFVIRLQVPAGYKVAPHWHPTAEQVTILAGSAAIGMGDSWDDAKMQTAGAGGYVAVPAEMRHYLLAKSATTLQVSGMGPFVVNYVNAADDPSKGKE